MTKERNGTPHFRNERKEKALVRQKVREKMTPQEQLDRLDMLLGKGVGAKRERARLTKQLEKNLIKEAK